MDFWGNEWGFGCTVYFFGNVRFESTQQLFEVDILSSIVQYRERYLTTGKCVIIDRPIFVDESARDFNLINGSPGRNIGAGGAPNLSMPLVSEPRVKSASAAPQIFNGLIVGVTVTDGGWGYTVEPEVRVEGGGGSGGAIITVLDKGKVSSVIVVSRGKNYSSVPTLVIDPPPNYFWTIPKIQMGGINLIKIDGEPRNRYRIEWSSMLPPYDMWKFLTNATITPAGYSFFAFNSNDQKRYYRNAFAPPDGFVWIERGSFLMGNSINNTYAGSTSGPQFPAVISKGFWICDHEVTQNEMFGQNVNTAANNSMVKGVNLPVDNISWLKVFEYSGKMTDFERKKWAIAAWL